MYKTAVRTRLAAWIPAIRNDDHPAALRRLVRQLTSELKKTHVGNSAQQAPVFAHAAHVQILNADSVKPARQIGPELVQSILPDVADSGVQPCQLRPIQSVLFMPDCRVVLKKVAAAREAWGEVVCTGQRKSRSTMK